MAQTTPSLQPGDIVAFSIIPDATAADFYHPTFPARLQSMTFKKYLGVITNAEVKAAILEDEDGNEYHGDQRVEVYELNFIASVPPDNTMLHGNERIISNLPNQSYSFASFPIGLASTSNQPSRPALNLVGNGVLPFPQAFAYTADGPPLVHLGALHNGETKIRLADGELDRLEEASAEDLDVIATAHEQADDQSQQLEDTASSQPSEANDMAGMIQNVLENRTTRPHITHVVVEFWTHLRDVEAFGHPSEFLKEVQDMDKALGDSWEEAPQAIASWAENVGKEQTKAANEYPPILSQSHPWSSKAAFAVGLVVGVGAGVLGMVLLRHIRIHK